MSELSSHCGKRILNMFALLIHIISLQLKVQYKHNPMCFFPKLLNFFGGINYPSNLLGNQNKSSYQLAMTSTKDKSLMNTNLPEKNLSSVLVQVENHSIFTHVSLQLHKQ